MRLGRGVTEGKDREKMNNKEEHLPDTSFLCDFFTTQKYPYQEKFYLCNRNGEFRTGEFGYKYK
jgi:hypothetical protein